MTMTRDSAETVGLHALAWLAGNEDLLPVFLGSTGASETDVRSGASGGGPGCHGGSQSPLAKLMSGQARPSPSFKVLY